MSILIVILHVVVCIALIMIVLLQTGKGADMGAAFGGGGSNTLFGATGASTFLSKLTTAAAVIFMLTSLILAYMAAKQESVPADFIQDQPAATAPASESSQTAQPQTAEQPETPTAPPASQTEEADK